MQEEGGWGREPLRMGLTFVQNVADDVPIVHCQSKCCVCVCACSFSCFLCFYHLLVKLLALILQCHCAELCLEG